MNEFKKNKTMELLKMYNLFYNKMPDFNDSQIYKEMSIMLAILSHYHIDFVLFNNQQIEIHNDGYIDIYDKNGIYDFKDIIDDIKCKNYWHIITIDNSSELKENKDIVNRIQIIRNELSELIDSKNYEELTKIAIFSSNTCCYKDQDPLDLTDLKNNRVVRELYCEEEIEKTYKLIKKIDKNCNNLENKD